MRIYLDNCVIQDLKRPEMYGLLDSIKLDKKNNVYCYSEAHLQDLMRDKSNQKFDDLRFMEDVVDGNCWHYDKKILFDHIKPKDFYVPFPEYSDNLFDSNELFSGDIVFKTMEEVFKNIPLDFNKFIKPNSLPLDFPVEMKNLLERPMNFYDFIRAFGDFTNELSATQKKFKELLSYLHNNNLTESLFKQVGIEGYNGVEITDKEKFRESYAKYFLTDKKGKYRYDLFIEQYSGLEFFSFVKGKPRKQKMMNLINDGRHAFFGGFCDIVVSKDIDFLEKTKFIYKMYDIQTLVLNLNDFQDFLYNSSVECKLNLVDMLNDGNEIIESNIIKNENGILSMRLDKTYFSYFNIVNYVENENGKYNFYTRYLQNMSSGSLKNEFEMIVHKLVEILGVDAFGNMEFSMSEINDDKWIGRVWRIKDTVIELNFEGKIYLAFYTLDYFKSTKTQHAI